MASSRGEFMYIDDEEDSIDRKDHAIMEEEQELFWDKAAQSSKEKLVDTTHFVVNQEIQDSVKEGVVEEVSSDEVSNPKKSKTKWGDVVENENFVLEQINKTILLVLQDKNISQNSNSFSPS